MKSQVRRNWLKEGHNPNQFYKFLKIFYKAMVVTFSLICVISCLFRLDLLQKLFSHVGHLCTFTSVWVLLCLFNESMLLNVSPQSLQTMPLWIFSMLHTSSSQLRSLMFYSIWTLAGTLCPRSGSLGVVWALSCAQ